MKERRWLDGTATVLLHVPVHLTLPQYALALALSDDFEPGKPTPVRLGLGYIRKIFATDSYTVMSDPHQIIAVETCRIPYPYPDPVPPHYKPFQIDLERRRRRYRQALDVVTGWHLFTNNEQHARPA